MEVVNIPYDLRTYASWGCYDKNKQLISAISGFSIKPNDYTSLTTFEDAVEYFSSHRAKVDGLAFVLPQGYVVIDIDKQKEDIYTEWITKINSYTELSTTKESVHIICKVVPKGITKVSINNGITLLTGGNYVCLTGELFLNIDNTINNACQNEFDNLYDYYFNGLTTPSPSTYSFSKRAIVSPKITESVVKNRISQLSLASNQFYQLLDGQWQQAGFLTKEDGVVALFNILIFWASGNKKVIYEIVKGSNIYTKDLEQKQGKLKIIDILYNDACNNQQVMYEEGNYTPENYVYDRNTCITKKFVIYSCDDTGNAQRMYDKYGAILHFVSKAKRFYLYNKDLGMWMEDTAENINTKKLLDIVIEEIKAEIQVDRIKNNDKLYRDYANNIKMLSSSKGKNNCLEELKHIGDIPIDFNLFDRHTMFLNTLSGVVNLMNGQILEHSPDLLMTKSTRCAIDTNNEPTLWLRCVREWCCGNEEMMRYFQRIFGYILTGSQKEKCYFVFLGEGNNGKSVIANISSALLGDYFVNVDIATFYKQKYVDGSRPNPDIVRMRGARFIRTNEPDEGAVLNERLMKQLTGNDVITARGLNKEPIQFSNQGKIIIYCNNLMKIQGTALADWTRLKRFEFNYIVPDDKIDRELEDKLMEELPQILGWCLKGCIEWQVNGLQEPASLKLGTSVIRQESNSVNIFVKNMTSYVPSSVLSSEDVFIAYKTWARKSGENEDISRTRFGIDLKRALNLFYEGKTTKIPGKSGRIYYKGFKLLELEQGVGTSADGVNNDLLEEE